MKVKVQFGAINGKIRVVSWHQDIMKLPHVVNFEGDDWEWIQYEKLVGEDGYSVIYGKSAPLAWLGTDVPEFESVFGWQSAVTSACECGAEYDRHFSNIHSTWCRKWTRI